MKKGTTTSFTKRLQLHAVALSWLAVGTAAATLTGPIVLLAAPQAVFAETRDEALTRFGEVYGTLQGRHVSGISDELLTDAAIQGMIDALKDLYTTYFSKSQWEQYQRDLDMVYAGIGTRLSQDDAGARIVEVFANSPAQETGLAAGDRITAVDGKPAAGLTLDAIAGAIRGAAGSEVTLLLLRGDGSTKIISLVRRDVAVPSVTSRVLNDGTGYMSVSGFADNTDELFADELAKLQASGIARLVVDLRNNPGGVLESARQMAQQFIPEGTLIHTKNRDGEDEPVLLAGGKTVDIPVVFLVNGNSASASEVLTGALQDYGKAVIVGSLTYGKGSVQSIYRLSSGGALKVTIEQYFTPKGKPVNKVGITPDVVVEGEIAQLAAALRASGSPAVTIELGTTRSVVNGWELGTTLPFVTESDQGSAAARLYVPARLAAAMLGRTLSWNEAKQAVELSAPGSATITFGAENGFVNKNGIGLLDTEILTKQFPSWSARLAGTDRVTLQVQVRTEVQ
ncbi:S41 family peptidase [Paenibacillus koleovorans]|uniref:S41 family peptidase n=1 Tax=Paenibacillus koleovorans TaxID=121608 RepID=UPI000FD72112|nr:S41 family peptidase [Paenibacillus koleovorans]